MIIAVTTMLIILILKIVTLKAVTIKIIVKNYTKNIDICTNHVTNNNNEILAKIIQQLQRLKAIRIKLTIPLTIALMTMLIE